MTNPTHAVLISKRQYLDECLSGDPLPCCTCAAEVGCQCGGQILTRPCSAGCAVGLPWKVNMSPLCQSYRQVSLKVLETSVMRSATDRYVLHVTAPHQKINISLPIFCFITGAKSSARGFQSCNSVTLITSALSRVIHCSSTVCLSVCQCQVPSLCSSYFHPGALAKRASSLRHVRSSTATGGYPNRNSLNFILASFADF